MVYYDNKKFVTYSWKRKNIYYKYSQYKLIRIIEVQNSDLICGVLYLNKYMLLTGDDVGIIRQWKIEGDNLVMVSMKENAHDEKINVLLNIGNGFIDSRFLW